MGKIGVFVILFAAVFSLAITPSIFDNSFAGTIAAPPPPEICNDGIDNDGDGLTDANDPDCIFVALVPVPGALPELPGFPDDPDPNVTPLLGDFKCYQDDRPLIFPRMMYLADQFQPDRTLFRTDMITEFCNNAIKEPSDDPVYPGSIPPTLPDQHYKVYEINCYPAGLPPGEECPDEIMDDVLLKDQWGTTRHMLLESIELWIPQEKCHDIDGDGECDMTYPIGDTIGVTPLPEDQIHWKCYNFDDTIDGQPFNVDLRDQFGLTQHQVLKLNKICTSVEKTVLECPPGTIDIEPGSGICNPVTGGDPVPPLTKTYGDRTINDHLKCYEISQDPDFRLLPFPVRYEGQFQADYLERPFENEVCLVANKIHVPASAIGGSFIPIDSSALLLLATQTTASWLIPVAVSAAGIGIILARKVSSKKE